MVEIIVQCGISLVVLGGFYGAVKTELNWIKATLEKHDKKLDKICLK